MVGNTSNNNGGCGFSSAEQVCTVVQSECDTQGFFDEDAFSSLERGKTERERLLEVGNS
jgi:hypothetical protein